MELAKPGCMVPVFISLICFTASPVHILGIPLANKRRAAAASVAGISSVSNSEWPKRTLRLEVADEGFTVNHLPKAGGCMLKDIVKGCMKNATIEDEDESLTADDVKNHFVIGLVRNPFDYYISLWTYNSAGIGGFKHALSQEEREECLGKPLSPGSVRGESSDDQERFRKFVRLINLKDMGTLSMRFFYSYLQIMQPSVEAQNFLQKSAVNLIGSNHTLLKLVKDGFHKFNPDSPSGQPVSCWVQTEDLIVGTRKCLKQYEKQLGQNVVNWQQFDKRSQGTRNPTQHAPCSTLYDEGTRAYVRQSDAYIFDKFNYPRGCLKED